MPPVQPNIRVIVRLPWNRPEESVPDPPPVLWNADKEAILWEVIAKSRAVEGAGTDWKGLATHLQVPLPYLLYRAQVRYEEDLRGLQGIKGALSPVSPPVGGGEPSHNLNPNANRDTPTGDYFPNTGTPVRVQFPRRDSLRAGSYLSSSSVGGAGAGAGRPPIRVRLNSLGHRSQHLPSPQQHHHPHPLKVSSSSVLTLQGPSSKRPRAPALSPTSSRSRASGSHSGSGSEGGASGADASGGSSDEDDDEGDAAEARREEEEERRLEEQDALDRKLRELERRMTKEAIGLVVSPRRAGPYRPAPQPQAPTQALAYSRSKGKDRDSAPVPTTRPRPLSTSSTGTSASSNTPRRLDMSRLAITPGPSGTRTPSHHSLSSASSPQGSIPSIPSPPPEPRSPQLSPIPAHMGFVPAAQKSTSPPAVSHGNAFGTVRNGPGTGTVGRAGGRGRSERGSEIGSGASSFSDFSDADLSESLESAMMSNMSGFSGMSNYRTSRVTSLNRNMSSRRAPTR